MNPTSAALIMHIDLEIAETLVLTALALFADMHLPQTSELVSELADTAYLQTLLQQPQRSWPELIDSLEQQLPRLPGTLGQVVRDYQLNAADFFLLSLCGVLESHHQAVLLIGLLQQPQQPRPELHLCCAICHRLFKRAYTPLDILQHPLVLAGFISLQGDEPLPLRQLQMKPQLWQVINGKTLDWSACRPLAMPDQSILAEALQQRSQQWLSLISQGHIRGLIVRGQQANCLLLAGQLAYQLGFKPVVIDLSVSQDKQIGIVARYGNWLPIIKPDLGPGEHWALPDTLRNRPCLIVLGRDGSIDASSMLEVEVMGLPLEQRQALWQQLLPGFDSSAVAESAHLSAPSIISIAEQASLQAMQKSEQLTNHHLLHARFLETSEQLKLLAQPVERYVDDSMLILPEALSQQLQHLILRCRRREIMHQGLGPTFDSAKNDGVRALFIGESGTGKTLAASFLASSLDAPLYRLDLAAVMNKYIGETEKNLSLMLDHAADQDVILLLDEADALFGKRSDGGEAGERFANMLTNFLLTRIEQHPGIILLTSNSQSRIDKAFMRRLDAVLEFPIPDLAQRRQLWLSHLGKRSPDEAFVNLLAQYCELPGGYIRNVVLNAAVLEDGQLARQAILQSLAWEYKKLGRQLPPQLDRFRGQ